MASSWRAIPWKIARPHNVEFPGLRNREAADSIEKIFDALLRADVAHEKDADRLTLAGVAARNEFALPNSARNRGNGARRAVSLGKFAAITDKYAAGKPASEAAENPVLQRV